MTKSITIVGCGNIGSRHLQAISKLKNPLNIHIVEPNLASQKIAKLRVQEVTNHLRHNYFWYERIDNLSSETDLTIIATSALGRVDLVTTLIEQGHNRLLVEKPACQSKKEYDLLLKKAKKNNVKGWINLPRRYTPIYQRIVPLFQENTPLKISVTGGDYGLGTNAIHFIDLFSWILLDNKIRMDTRFLTPTLLSNKRGKIFKEFSGTLLAYVKNSLLTISFNQKSSLPLTLEITNPKSSMFVNETDHKVVYSHPKNLENIEFNLYNVSDTTKAIAEDILYKNKCLLPTLEDCYPVHIELFRTFNSFIETITHKKTELCPIT